MANYELGCLLGAYDGAQSFEGNSSYPSTVTSPSLLPTGWVVSSGQSFSQSSNDFWVHSSNMGMRFLPSNNIPGTMSFDYSSHGFFYERASTEVDTHYVTSYSWCKVKDDEYYLEFTDATSIKVTGDSTNWFLHNISSYVSTGDNISFKVGRDAGKGTDAFQIDDILTAVDVVQLNPSFELSDNEALLSAEHSTLNKSVVRYKQGNIKQWSVPVDYLPSSEAALINDWWSKQYKLLWTVDSTAYVVQLVNDTTPVTKLKRPYTDIFKTVLKLQAVHTSLDF